ncbi:hypothetical protein MTP99_001616 [Tenebrio molitor]|nr:hypothetical protein MTP99_001616 [Tenebrio molitor]
MRCSHDGGARSFEGLQRLTGKWAAKLRAVAAAAKRSGQARREISHSCHRLPHFSPSSDPPGSREHVLDPEGCDRPTRTSLTSGCLRELHRLH